MAAGWKLWFEVIRCDQNKTLPINNKVSSYPESPSAANYNGPVVEWKMFSNTQIHKYTKNTQTHEYTNTQIHKHTNTQIHKYINTEIHKCTNTQIQKYINA